MLMSPGSAWRPSPLPRDAAGGARQRRPNDGPTAAATAGVGQTERSDPGGPLSISAIKIYRQEHRRSCLQRLSDRYRDAALALARTRSTLFRCWGINSLSLLVLLGLSISQLANGNLTLGGLVALILYVERLVFPTALLGFTLSTFQTGQVSLERVEELLRRQPAINHRGKGAAESASRAPSRPMTCTSAMQTAAVCAQRCQLRQPGVVAVVGPVGCRRNPRPRLGPHG